jgi:hypothetical protein
MGKLRVSVGGSFNENACLEQVEATPNTDDEEEGEKW